MQKSYLLPEVSVRESFDVIVAGGGPAGVCAAIAAARDGARVLLLEQQYCLGGQWTSGFVNPVFDHKNKTGLLQEFIADLAQHDAWGGFRDRSFHYEYMKELLERKCVEAGVDVRFGVSCTHVLQQGNRVCGVVTVSVEGMQAFAANVVIDATADAVLAADAGASWQLGDEETGDCQAMTLMFLVGNIPEKYRQGLKLREVLPAAYEKQGLGKSMPYDRPYLIPAPGGAFGVVQLTHMRGYDPLSDAGRTRAVMEGRRQMLEVFELLRTYDPDFRDLCLIQSAPIPGIRESRRIVGDYTLTQEDLLTGAQFSDGVTTVTFGVDIHNSRDINQTCVRVAPYQIPYRCMLPAGIEGLLVAGKCISGTHFAMASYRVTGNCSAMGESAGKAAAWAGRNGMSLRQVPDAIVREIKPESIG